MNSEVLEKSEILATKEEEQVDLESLYTQKRISCGQRSEEKLSHLS